MGTTWHATVFSDDETKAGLTTLVQSRLDELEAVFTNWDASSPVSRFNDSPDTEWQSVPRELAEVVAFARTLSEATEGAFDVTAAPLIDLWGFGAKGRINRPPDVKTIADVKSRCGWQKLEVRMEPPMLRKMDGALQINVSALAEGYAIDDLVRRLHARGVKNFLLEVGGELHASGTKADGAPWQAGIQQPDAAKGSLATSMPLQDEALATSGTYQQYREFDGKRASHILDARTGRPVKHSAVSVSVTAKSCLVADGWATALLILGGEAGKQLAADRDVAAMFIEAKSTTE